MCAERIGLAGRVKPFGMYRDQQKPAEAGNMALGWRSEMGDDRVGCADGVWEGGKLYGTGKMPYPNCCRWPNSAISLAQFQVNSLHAL